MRGHKIGNKLFDLISVFIETSAAHYNVIHTMVCILVKWDIVPSIVEASINIKIPKLIIHCSNKTSQ